MFVDWYFDTNVASCFFPISLRTIHWFVLLLPFFIWCFWGKNAHFKPLLWRRKAKNNFSLSPVRIIAKRVCHPGRSSTSYSSTVASVSFPSIDWLNGVKQVTGWLLIVLLLFIQSINGLPAWQNLSVQLMWLIGQLASQSGFFCSKENSAPKARFKWKAHHPELEVELHVWILSERAKCRVVRHSDIIEKALQIAAREGFDKFKASHCWLDKFKKRFRLGYRKMTHDSRKTEFSDKDLVNH